MKGIGVRHVYVDEGGTHWWSRTVKGKRIWVNLETQNRHQAVLNALELERQPNLQPSTSQFADEIGRFLQFKARNGYYTSNTADNRRFMLQDLAQHIPPGVDIAHISRTDIQRWYDGLRQRVKENTAQTYFQAARAFFRWACEVARLRPDNPTKEVRLARLPTRGRRLWLDSQIANELIADAPDDDLRFILLCGFRAGLRREEIVEARAEWFSERRLHVTQTPTFVPKDGEDRTIPLSPKFREFLRTYLAGKEPTDFAVRPDVHHGVWRYRWDFRRPFSNYVREKGYPWVTPHVMRHSFASNLAQAGESIFKIAEWLGDDVRVVQKTYAKLAPDREEGIRVLD